MNELEKLKADHAALGERIAALEAQQAKEPDVDWSQMVGRLVEVRDYDDNLWGIHVFKQFLSNNAHFPFKAGHCNWKQCRPYTGPLRPNFITHDRGTCPVEPETMVVVRYENGSHAAYTARFVSWGHVTGYQVIEP